MADYVYDYPVTDNSVMGVLLGIRWQGTGIWWTLDENFAREASENPPGGGCAGHGEHQYGVVFSGHVEDDGNRGGNRYGPGIVSDWDDISQIKENYRSDWEEAVANGDVTPPPAFLYGEKNYDDEDDLREEIEDAESDAFYNAIYDEVVLNWEEGRDLRYTDPKRPPLDWNAPPLFHGGDLPAWSNKPYGFNSYQEPTKQGAPNTEAPAMPDARPMPMLPDYGEEQAVVEEIEAVVEERYEVEWPAYVEGAVKAAAEAAQEFGGGMYEDETSYDDEEAGISTDWLDEYVQKWGYAQWSDVTSSEQWTYEDEESEVTLVPGTEVMLDYVEIIYEGEVLWSKAFSRPVTARRRRG